jgi:hypothetical protein
MLVESRKQRLYASHHQFYVEDRDRPGDAADPEFWTKQASDDRLAVVEGTVGIGTGTYGEVEVTTEIHDEEPPLDVDVWDHVTEAALKVRSGYLQVVGCLEDKGEEFKVGPGDYRIRCCHANLAESNEFGEGRDWYLVQIWPAPHSPRLVVRRWSPAG